MARLKKKALKKLTRQLNAPKKQIQKEDLDTACCQIQEQKMKWLLFRRSKTSYNTYRKKKISHHIALSSRLSNIPTFPCTPSKRKNKPQSSILSSFSKVLKILHFSILYKYQFHSSFCLITLMI